MNKFKVGEPVIFHGDIAFVSDMVFGHESQKWSYRLELTQENMCSRHKWQGGGSCFWVPEDEVSAPTGEKKLLGELWLEIRTADEFSTELKYCQERADKIRYALSLVAPETK